VCGAALKNNNNKNQITISAIMQVLRKWNTCTYMVVDLKDSKLKYAIENDYVHTNVL